ncbi:hypothetical protein [Paractinoplanes brasiliensis]|uniref:Uncharacterized protein n=1 Tax=Paractinoplanes brasiliensis TaxID=52695 RepID=A0A4R6JPQ8_9ACTN|nr:hypothetical protein [Actinoplanes brasiliensis]TDO36806.1 hypothetical protein C8E87_0388 [Actinoplanes brasiliensis]GID30322.1 hypothetical protein Abr02nite_53050 [Actinoplanes brasiliensis]
MRRGIAASAVALAMLLTGTAQPARAADGLTDDLFNAAVIGTDIGRSGRVTPEQALQLIRIVGRILGVMESEVRTQADGLVAANILSRVVSVQDDWRNYEVIRQDELGAGLFAQRVNEILNDAVHYYPEVSTRAKDQLALSAQAVYSIVQAARADAGYTEGAGAIEGRFRSLMLKVVDDLRPRCTPINANPEPVPGEISTIWECVAVDGRKATAHERIVNGEYVEGPVDLHKVRMEAARASSWAAAYRVWWPDQP